MNKLRLVLFSFLHLMNIICLIHIAIELYPGLVHVNWWEATPYLIQMPWGLKRYWQSRFRDKVQKWVGNSVALEDTDIYGIRRYTDGARLLSHTDREETHAVSLIINVDQEEMREPWTVEIYDFAGRLHEIVMEPGDIVYYEVCGSGYYS